MRSIFRSFLAGMRPATARLELPKSISWLVVATAIAALLYAAPAEAQSIRTYVSNRGSDSNSCSRSAPCQTLQVALSKTLPGGQIFALNAGNYGSVTITQAVSITNADTATGVLASSSVNGVTINAGANDAIDLRGFDIDGGGSGATGIQFNSGASLQIRDSIVRGFVTGISFQPGTSSTLLVDSTLLSTNSTGISVQTTAASTAVLNDVQVINSSSGIVASGANSTAPAGMTVRNSVVANNSTVGILSNGYSAITVTDSTIANNGIGVEAQNAGALLWLSGSTVGANGTGWMVATGGQVVSNSNNSIGGNTSGNSAPPTTTAATPPPPPPPPPPLTVYLLDQNGGYILDANGAKVTAS